MVAQPGKREINMFCASRRPFLSVEQLFNTQGMTTTTQTLSSGSGTAKDSPVKNLSLQWSIWSILNVRMRTNIHFTWMGQLLQPLPPLTPKLDLETLQSILDFSRLVYKPGLYPWINDDFEKSSAYEILINLRVFSLIFSGQIFCLPLSR